METQPIQKRTWLLYTLFFIGMVLFIYGYFVMTGTSFIWQGDGFSQHYQLFYDYVGKLQGLLTGNGFSFWDWTIGMGADTLISYGYYVVGDPFVYLGILFPESLRELAYHLLLLARLWCIGASFLFYARKIKLSHKAGVLGAIMYAFSHYAIYNVTRHPFFLLPLVWYPLLCLGVEKILRKESAAFFTVMVAVSAIANFYFFYKLTLLVLLYGAVRYGFLYGFHSWRETFQMIWQCILPYLIGVMLSAVIFLPIAGGFLNASRSPEGTATSLLYYPLEYYGLLLANFFTPGSAFWTVGGFSIFTLFSLFFLWKRRRNYPSLLTVLLILGIFTLIPFFGSVMNGFAGPYNRFTFAIPFYLAIASGRFLEERERMKKKEFYWMSGGLLFFTILHIAAMLIYGDLFVFSLPIVIGWILWSLLIWEHHVKKKKVTNLLLIFVAINMAGNALAFYYPIGRNTMSTMLDYGEAEESYAGLFAGLEKSLPQNEWYRVGVTSKDNHVKNQFTYLNLMGLNSYLSITDEDISKFAEELEVGSFQLIQPLRNGFDDRRIVNHLLGVRFILTNQENRAYLPEGYDVIQEKDNYVVAETKNAYPFAYVENTYLPYSQFAELNPVEKEAFLAKGIVLDDEIEFAGLHIFDEEIGFDTIPFEVVERENVSVQEGDSFEVTEEKAQFTLKLLDSKGLIGKELFVYLESLQYEPYENHTLLNQEDTSYWTRVKMGDLEKSIGQSDQYSFSSYFHRETMLFNMGYVEEVEDELTIQFDDTGHYEVENVTLYALPVSQEEDEKVASQKWDNALKLHTFDSERIEGMIQQDNPSLLVLSIPYTKGWKASINGEKIDTVKTNLGFIGVPLQSGKSEVVLQYQTPLLRTGMLLSFIGLVLLVYKHRSQLK